VPRCSDASAGNIADGPLLQLPRADRIDTVFLDRDGTVNVKAPEGRYIERPDDLVLLPGAATAISRLNAAGIRVVLVTNQRWLSRPTADYTAFAATQSRLGELLEREGARLDAAYHCPHGIGVCRCRKPAPGMLNQAVRDLGVDLGASAIVGDMASDLMAGRSAGVSTVLLDAQLSAHPLADIVAVDLEHAVGSMLEPEDHPCPGCRIGPATDISAAHRDTDGERD
jgi:D-glycero-D-manno-heptose 1,7-bisphosphate phosphatase